MRSKQLLVRLNDGREIKAPSNVEPPDFDELIAEGASVHMEMMSGSHLWMGIDAGGFRYMVNIWPQKRKLCVRVEQDGKTFVRKPAKRNPPNAP